MLHVADLGLVAKALRTNLGHERLRFRNLFRNEDYRALRRPNFRGRCFSAQHQVYWRLSKCEATFKIHPQTN